MASSVAAVVDAGLARLLSALPQMAEQHPPIAPALVSRLAQTFVKKKETYDNNSWYSSDSDRDRRCRPDRKALLSLLDYLADDHEEVRGQGPLTQAGHSLSAERELSHAPCMHAPPHHPLPACPGGGRAGARRRGRPRPLQLLALRRTGHRSHHGEAKGRGGETPTRSSRDSRD